jgi:hypothetical protein
MPHLFTSIMLEEQRKEGFMTNDDKQGAVPFSPQESEIELDEQALEGVTGGGWFTNLFKSRSASGAPMATETGRVYTNQVPPVHEVAGGGMSAEQVKSRLDRNMSVSVQPGTPGYDQAVNQTFQMSRNRR